MYQSIPAAISERTRRPSPASAPNRVVERLRHARDDHHGAGGGEERQPGLQRRVVRAPPARRASAGRSSRRRPRRAGAPTDVRAGDRARPGRCGTASAGAACALSITRNATSSAAATDERARSSATSPSRRSGAFEIRVDEQREAGGDRRPRRRRRSSGPRPRAALARRTAASAANTSAPTGTLTKKIHSQPSVLRQHAADEHAGGRAAAADRAPDPERLVPLRRPPRTSS